MLKTNSDLKEEVDLRRIGRMVVFIEGKKTSRKIDSIEVSQNPFSSNKEIPELFIDEQVFETTDGKSLIIKLTK